MSKFFEMPMAQPEKEEYYSSACNVSTPDMGTHGGREQVNGVDLESTERSINVKQIDQ